MSTSPRRGPSLLIAAALVAALASLAVVVFPSQSSAPVASLRFGPNHESVVPFDEVHSYDAMRLHLDLPFDAWVYVVGFDYDRGTVTYFPSEYLGTDLKQEDGTMHHLAKGTHEIPGTWDDKPIEWFVPQVHGALSMCVVVSAERITRLEALLPLTRQVGNTAFPTRVMGDYMPRAGRDKRIGKRTLPHPTLLNAQNQREAILPGPMVPSAGDPNVFVKVFNVRPVEPRPGVTAPDNPLAQQLLKVKEVKVKVEKAGAKK